MIREAPVHPLAAARRKALMLRFAVLAAGRLATVEDPEGMAMVRNGWRSE